MPLIQKPAERKNASGFRSIANRAHAHPAHAHIHHHHGAALCCVLHRCSSFPDPHITWIYRYYKYRINVCQGVRRKIYYLRKILFGNWQILLRFECVNERIPRRMAIYKQKNTPGNTAGGIFIIRGRARRSGGSFACPKIFYCCRRGSGR